MFTLYLQDEALYQQLMQQVEQNQTTLDAVLRDLLNRTETPGQRLLRLIDATDFPFTHPFNGRDAEEILRQETGVQTWRNTLTILP
ncbi:MAG: hypothetical protein H7Y11_14980 [Armatimonadetes bacterium]|nr:hypothetical protein [Anaerolineae bacterium]